MSIVMTIIRFTIILPLCVNLVYCTYQQNDIKKRYLSYLSHEFDKELKVKNLAFHEQFIKPIEDNKKREQTLKIQKQQEAEKNSLSRGGNIQEEIFVLTFYTSLNEENGYGPITCNGSKLRDGIVANNVLPQGTKISTREYGQLVVADRGGNNFNTRHRLDVFISRNRGENDYQYKTRVNAMGIVKVKGYIIK